MALGQYNVGLSVANLLSDVGQLPLPLGFILLDNLRISSLKIGYLSLLDSNDKWTSYLIGILFLYDFRKIKMSIHIVVYSVIWKTSPPNKRKRKITSLE